jgi:hypothetical protein
MAEVEARKPNLRPIGTDRSPTDFLKDIEQSQRHFLGLYQDSWICAGTDDSQAGCNRLWQEYGERQNETVAYKME